MANSVTLCDPSNAEVLVFTYKEGLLSPVAHDLKLRVTRFRLDASDSSVSGEFETGSLRVVCAMKEGQEAPRALPAFASAEIERTIVKSVLTPGRYPTVRFESTWVTESKVEGLLTLQGVAKKISGTRRDEPGASIAEFRLDQREFGIRPYSAMLGTLKVRPEIRVQITLKIPGGRHIPTSAPRE